MRFWQRNRDEIVDREFLVATDGTALALGEHVLDDDLEIAVCGTVMPDERTTALPMFTSEKRLRELMGEDSPWMALRGRDVLTLFLGGPWEIAVIDPASRDSRQISRAEAERLVNTTG